jgi:hypothetical protein
MMKSGSHWRKGAVRFSRYVAGEPKEQGAVRRADSRSTGTETLCFAVSPSFRSSDAGGAEEQNGEGGMKNTLSKIHDDPTVGCGVICRRRGLS